LVLRDENGYIVNFPFWDAPLRDRIIELGTELASRVADVIRAEIPTLRRKFDQSSLPSQGYTWDRVALIVVGGLLLDTGLNDRGLRRWGIFDQKRDTPVRPGGYLYWYRAIEGGWGNYWKFGHDQRSSPDLSTWFCMFYGQKTSRKRIDWSSAWDAHAPTTKQITFPLVRTDVIDRDSLLLESGLSELTFQSSLTEMAEAGIVNLEGTKIRRVFPVFNETDIDMLLEHVDTICTRIIDSIYVPFLPRIEEEWLKVAPENWKIQNVLKMFIRDVYDRPYNLTLHLLIEEGTLPPSPTEPPFDYFGINGYFEML
jgi:hypothetical protein